MFVAAASSIAVVGGSVADCIDAGLSVVPPDSRYADAIRRGADLASSSVSAEGAIDAIHAGYGHLHWVHVLNNSALLAFALMRSDGDFADAVTTVVSGGWDTDSNGATAGALCGAIGGAASIPAAWTAPLHNRLASSLRGFDGIGFDVLAQRTLDAAERAKP